MTDTEVLEAQSAQREHAKRATFALLRDKRPAEREFTIKLGEESVSFLFRAIGAIEYDKLITACRPTLEQKAEGATYNPDTFAPKLLARVSIEPAMTEDEWRELWTGPAWSRGETGDIFFAAVQLCSRGLDVDPTVPG